MTYIVCTVENGNMVGLYQGLEPVGQEWFEKGFFEHRNRRVLEKLGYKKIR